MQNVLSKCHNKKVKLRTAAIFSTVVHDANQQDKSSATCAAVRHCQTCHQQQYVIANKLFGRACSLADSVRLRISRPCHKLHLSPASVTTVLCMQAVTATVALAQKTNKHVAKHFHCKLELSCIQSRASSVTYTLFKPASAGVIAGMPGKVRDFWCCKAEQTAASQNCLGASLILQRPSSCATLGQYLLLAQLATNVVVFRP